MRRQGWMSLVAAAAVMFVTAGAQAQTVTTEKQTVSPGTPAPVVAQPVAVQQPVQAVPVAATPTTSKAVVTETNSENYMATIAKSTFFGAVAGALVGGAIYFIARDDVRPITVAYWTAGGALVGVAAGVIQVAANENRAERAVSKLYEPPSMEKKSRGLGGYAFGTQLVNVAF